LLWLILFLIATGGYSVTFAAAPNSRSLRSPQISQVTTPQPELLGVAQDGLRSYIPLIIRNACTSCYYVDSNGGLDSNSGTQPEKPWKTLSKLNAVSLQPGSVVHFKRGSIWTEKLLVTVSGLPDKPITFTAYGSGPAPIISNPNRTSQTDKTIFLQGSYIIIENIKIQESGTAIGIVSFSDHNIIRNNEIMTSGIGVVIQGQYNLITGNYIHDLNMVVNTVGGNYDDYGALGVDILNSHNEVSFNKFVNCEAPSFDYGMNGGATEIFQTGDYTNVHHNWVLNTQRFMEVNSNATIGSAKNVTISYNVIINSTKVNGAHVSRVQIQNFRVENNTIVDLRTHDPLIGSFISFDGNPLPDTYILRNNIIYISDYYWVSTFQFTHQNNLYYFPNPKTQLGFSLGTGELVTNPQFIDSANNDFHLISTSPALDRGMILGYDQDFDRNLVPVNNLPDLGAFEHQ